MTANPNQTSTLFTDALCSGSSVEQNLYVILDLPDLGSSNAVNLEEARRILLSAAARARGSTIEIEIRALRVGAAFVEILASANTMTREYGGRIIVCCDSPHVREVLTACGYDHLLR